MVTKSVSYLIIFVVQHKLFTRYCCVSSVGTAVVVDKLGKLSGGNPGILFKSVKPVELVVVLRFGKFNGGKLRFGKFSPAILVGVVKFGVLVALSPAATLSNFGKFSGGKPGMVGRLRLSSGRFN